MSFFLSFFGDEGLGVGGGWGEHVISLVRIRTG